VGCPTEQILVVVVFHGLAFGRWRFRAVLVAARDARLVPKEVGVFES